MAFLERIAVGRGAAPNDRLRADATTTGDIVVLRLGGPLYTANARTAEQRILALIDAATPRPTVLVLDAAVQARLSVTFLNTLLDRDHQLAGRGVTLWLAALPTRALGTARRTTWFGG